MPSRERSIWKDLMGLITRRLKFSNRSTAPGYPPIPSPQVLPLVFSDRRVALGLLQATLWLSTWPSVTELLQIFLVIPLLFVPFPELVNNVLEEVCSWFYGKAGEDALPSLFRHPVELTLQIPTLLARIERSIRLALLWPRHLLGYNVYEPNSNHDLSNYFQGTNVNPPEVLDGGLGSTEKHFPTDQNGGWAASKSNALALAYISRLCYERWHVVKQALAPHSNLKFQRAFQFDDFQFRPVDEDANISHKEGIFGGPCAGEPSCASADYVPPQKPDGGLQVALPAAAPSSSAPLKGLPSSRKEPIPLVNTNAVLVTVGKKALVLAFRGTMLLQNVNWLTDFQAVPPERNEGQWPHGKFHTGFRTALGLKSDLQSNEQCRCRYIKTSPAGDDVRVPSEPGKHEKTSPYKELQMEVDRILREHEEDGMKLYITGHSLGGALAVLMAAAWLQSPETDRSRLGALFTFGQPRVGDFQFITELEALLNKDPTKPSYVRVVNLRDIVPRIPPPLNNFYQHPGHLALLDAPFRSRSVQKLIEQPENFFTWSLAASWTRLVKAIQDYCSPKGPLNDETILRLLSRLGAAGMLGYGIGLSDHSMGDYIAVIKASKDEEW